MRRSLGAQLQLRTRDRAAAARNRHTQRGAHEAHGTGESVTHVDVALYRHAAVTRGVRPIAVAQLRTCERLVASRVMLRLRRRRDGDAQARASQAASRLLSRGNAQKGMAVMRGDHPCCAAAEASLGITAQCTSYMPMESHALCTSLYPRSRSACAGSARTHDCPSSTRGRESDEW